MRSNPSIINYEKVNSNFDNIFIDFFLDHYFKITKRQIKTRHWDWCQSMIHWWYLIKDHFRCNNDKKCNVIWNNVCLMFRHSSLKVLLVFSDEGTFTGILTNDLWRIPAIFLKNWSGSSYNEITITTEKLCKLNIPVPR